MKRTVGRPNRRWIEEVEREMKGLDVKDWKCLALERDKWKKIVEEAKAVETRRERENPQHFFLRMGSEA
jgi:hypothetical protein